MSEVIYHRCDMCGGIIIDEIKMGYLHSPLWGTEEYDTELCCLCLDKVERFIDGYQMVNGYKTDIERRQVAGGEVRNSCETAAKQLRNAQKQRRMRMDVRAVLAVADEMETSERDAVSEFVRCDGLDAVGAAYAAGGIDMLDGGWAKQLRSACECDQAALHDMLDMAAFNAVKLSVKASDMLSALAQAVKVGTGDAMREFEGRWLVSHDGV